MDTLFDEEVAEEERRQEETYQKWVATHCRPTHPATSVEAAEYMAPNVGKTMGLALDMLESYPGRTAAELDSIAGHGNGTIRKRLSDLRQMGLAHTAGKKKCTITGRNAQVWHAGKGA